MSNNMNEGHQGNVNMTDIKEFIGEDYVHSSNSLFHFMTSPKYLMDALQLKALCPRYCTEDVAYLNITNDGAEFKEVSVLQKCFCDIPLRNIVKRFPVNLTDNNEHLTKEQKEKIPKELSHTDLYGEYALAFSKRWGEKNRLQPIHYLNEDADCALRFSKMLHDVLGKENILESVPDGLLSWMCFCKPLRGTMRRRKESKNNGRFEYEIFKNFHDEHEWRYVPLEAQVDGNQLDCLIANDAVQSGVLRTISDNMAKESFQSTWLPFEYDEIRYIIVPSDFGRIEIINTIKSIPNSSFSGEAPDLQKAILMSKILVLSEIAKDF